jgi:small GTP-binding protein
MSFYLSANFVYNTNMSLNKTPSANRVHIAFFGRRNAGKSSLVNAVTGQNLAVVSGIKGTTTDPVYKAMELLPLGPVVIIDTPGFDDEGELGEMRVQKTLQVLNKTDIAVLVLDGELPPDTALSAIEVKLIGIFKDKNIPYIIAHNKCDIFLNKNMRTQRKCYENCTRTQCSPCPVWLEKIEESSEISVEILPVSTKTGMNISLLKEKIAAIAFREDPKQPLVEDLIRPLDLVILVIPIDKAAPKGRLILPQQQMIRCILEAGGIAVTVRDSELKKTLASLGRNPALVITDSQIFGKVSAIVPQEIPLTSFSILFARHKGWLETAVKGAAALNTLQDGDNVLICESCTHHRQCDDIGTVKLPRWIKSFTSKEPVFSFCSGSDFPQDISSYKLIIHCGACMINEREIQYRRRYAEAENIPFTNYGIALALIMGILDRSIAMLTNNRL